MINKMGLKIRKRDNRLAVLETEGYIDTRGGDSILSACNALLDEGIHRLVVNIEKSKAINSTSALYLLSVAEQAKSLGGGVAFCGATPTIAKAFEVMGLLSYAAVYDTETEALQAIEHSQ
jgi:anti-anti-sigma factor